MNNENVKHREDAVKAELRERVLEAIDSFLAHRADVVSIRANQRRLRRKRRALRDDQLANFGRRQ